jgi:hypothetical protein
VDLILGLPFETAASFRDSLNRVFAFAPHYIQLGLLKVLPGTDMARHAGEYGLIHCSEPPYEVLATRWMDHHDLRGLYELCECVESFYNNRFFPSLWTYLRRGDEEPFAFFSGLAAQCREQGFFQRARTQQLMTAILAAYGRDRADGALLLELLRHDWLRCGHRRLPDCLASRQQYSLRDRLRRRLPQNLDGLFDYRSRVEFFKQSTFLELSAEAMEIIAPEHGAPACLAFLPDQETGVMRFCKTRILPPAA